jgi:hypothetical protein
MTTSLLPVAENLWLMRYPLSMLGAQMGRNVTLIRLRSGKIVVHSSAPFTRQDVATIHKLGDPAWLVEAMLRHDTFSSQGRSAFPDAVYLAPAGFASQARVSTLPLFPPPEEWAEELDVVRVLGAPSFDEHVFFHRPSHTLIVADLIFNFGADEPLWTELMLKIAAVGGEHTPGMTRLFKSAIENEEAFRSSMAAILAWDFNRIIVGHGDMIANSGREKLKMALRHAELDPGVPSILSESAP